MHQAFTPMVLVEGPLTIVTSEGEVELPEDWKGMLAMDSTGHPYPISLDLYHKLYQPVGTMRVPLR